MHKIELKSRNKAHQPPFNEDSVTICKLSSDDKIDHWSIVQTGHINYGICFQQKASVKIVATFSGQRHPQFRAESLMKLGHYDFR